MSRFLFLITLIFDFGGLNSWSQCPNLVEQFGDHGLVVTNFTSNYDDRASCSVRKPNGEIIVGGYTKVNGSVQRIATAYYKPNGQLNTTIMNGGKVILTSAGTPQTLQHLKWTANGKLVAGGYIRFLTNDHFLFARFNADGQLDPGFNTYGWLGTLYHKSEIDEVRSFEILPSGKIFAVGVINPVYVVPSKNMVLIMLTSEGIQDSTFADNGMKEIKFINGVDDIPMCSLLSGSEMLIGGYFDDQHGDVDGFIIRVNQNGTILWTKTYQPQGYKTYITNMIALTDGNILASGFCVDGSNTFPFLLKVTTTGDIIEGFGNSGFVIVDSDGNTRGARLVETDDSYYLLANLIGPFNIELYRFFKNGDPDTAFAESGVMELDNNNKVDDGSGIYWLGGDTLLVTGTSNNDFALWKVNACTEITGIRIPSNPESIAFPNPVSDFLTIQGFEDIQVVDRIEIFRPDGSLAWSPSSDNYYYSGDHITIPMNFLKPGAYMVKIQSEKRMRIFKIVKVE